MAELTAGFHCEVCGEEHATLPLSFSVKYPLAATRIPPDEVERRIVMTPDQCVIDERFFFLRGRIVVPVHALTEAFLWGVWAEVSPRSFVRTQQLWTVPGREAEPTFSGWLDTDLPIYGSTLNLEVRVKTQKVGRRPHFEVVDALHPLGVEQRAGIPLARVKEIAAACLHPTGKLHGTGNSR